MRTFFLPPERQTPVVRVDDYLQSCHNCLQVDKPGKGVGQMDLSTIKTCDLVQELSKREGVEKRIAKPYQVLRQAAGDYLDVFRERTQEREHSAPAWKNPGRSTKKKGRDER